MPTASVAKKILVLLAARLAAIQGGPDFTNTVGARVYRSRFSYDLAVEGVPAIFIARRAGGDSRATAPSPPFQNVTITFDIVGVVLAGVQSGDAAEDLLADIERAIEIETDKFLLDASTSKNLLAVELLLVGAQLEAPPEGSKYEAVAVGVQCTFPKRYGDPSYVQ